MVIVVQDVLSTWILLLHLVYPYRVEVCRIAVPTETSLWLDPSSLSPQITYHNHKIRGECPGAVRRSKRKTHPRSLGRYPYKALEVLSVK